MVVHICCPQVQTLEAQNRILRKNITCLFKTAKAEVQRKDAIMQEQRDKCVNFVRVLCVHLLCVCGLAPMPVFCHGAGLPDLKQIWQQRTENLVT